MKPYKIIKGVKKSKRTNFIIGCKQLNKIPMYFFSKVHIPKKKEYNHAE